METKKNYRLSLDNKILYLLDDLNLSWIGLKTAIFRGQNLGDHVTDEQWEEIRTGRFRNMFLGDYWTINGITFWIVDFNYWFENCGNYNTEVYNNHHLVIMPLYSSSKFGGEQPMNDTATTVGAYIGSKMYTNILPNKVLPHILQAFGEEHVLKRYNFYCNAIDPAGNQNGIVTRESLIDLPSECMIFGSGIFSSRTANSAGMDTNDHNQLAYFSIQHRHIQRINYWLRDVTDSTRFCLHGNTGQATRRSANGLASIVPLFAIGVKK